MCKTGLNGCNFTLKQLCDSLNGASLRVHCWWFFLGSSARALRVTVLQVSQLKEKTGKKKKRKTSGAHSGEKASANTKTLGDGPNALKPESNTERMTTKIETFRRASAFALHVLL